MRVTVGHQDSLAQRREWFRFFPDGSVEFLLVTRVLAVGLMLLLAIVRSSQAIQITAALVPVLCADHLLLIWWCIQVHTDLRHLGEAAPPSAAAARRERTLALLTASLPLCAVLLVATPWDRLAFQFESQRLTVMRIVLPALALVFLLTLLPAQRALKRAGLEPPVWTFLLLVPILHWFALRRILVRLGTRIEPLRLDRPSPDPHHPAGGIALIIADVAWCLMLIPWAGFIILSFEWGQWVSAFLKTTCALAGAGTTMVMLTAELAALEQVQHQFVHSLEKEKGSANPRGSGSAP